MPSKPEIIIELQHRRAARKSIKEYIYYMRQTMLPAFEHDPAAHHLILIPEFEDMLNGVFVKGAFSLPPGSAKSFYGSVILPTLILARDPKLQILCVSNTESLAEGFARSRRSILRTPQWERLSNSALAKDAQSLSFQGTTRGGGDYGVIGLFVMIC